MGDKLGSNIVRPSQVVGFKDFINSYALLELSYKGHAYTWFSKRFGHQAILQQLNRALMSTDWLACFPRAQLLHGDLLASDHRPLLLSLFGGLIKRSFYFILNTSGCCIPICLTLFNRFGPFNLMVLQCFL